MTGNGATSYTVSSFYLPFSLTSGSMAVTGGTNVDTISMNVKTPSGTTYPFSGASSYTKTGGFPSGTYTNEGVSIVPLVSTQRTNVLLSLSGTVGTVAGNTLTLDTTGATSGSSITVTVDQQSATYAVYVAPSGDNTGGDGGSGVSGAAAAAQMAPVQNNAGSITTSVTNTGSVSSGSVSAGGVSGMSGATASWSGSVSTQPSSGATITTTISQDPPAATLAAYQSVYQVQGTGIGAVAYTMTVSKNGVTTSGPATITMSVPRSWVESHGGVNSMSIARQGDDGVTESLTTQFTGYDSVTGDAIFTATSPHGLSIFALVSTQSLTAGNTTVTTTPVITSTQPMLAPTTAPGSISTTGQPTNAPTTGTTKTPLSPLVSIGALSLVLIITANIKNRK
jgi:hypothetical protein